MEKIQYRDWNPDLKRTLEATENSGNEEQRRVDRVATDPKSILDAGGEWACKGAAGQANNQCP